MKVRVMSLKFMSICGALIDQQKSNKGETMSPPFEISQSKPGSILQDFQILLAFIGNDGELVSQKQMFFSAATLIELNQKMTKPIMHDKKRPTQKTFPHIGIVFQLAKLLGLLVFETEGSRKRVCLNATIVEQWQQLNVTEQYFILLETWLKGDPDEKQNSFMSPFIRLGRVLEICLNKPESYYQTVLVKEYQISPMLAGMELFGLFIISHDKPEPNGGWKISNIQLSKTGKVVTKFLEKDIAAARAQSPFGYLMHLAMNESPTSLLYDVFKKDFPAFKQHSFGTKKIKEKRTGIFVFKVSWGKVWRRVEIIHEASLFDLAKIIIEIFEFEDDHLHMFKFVDKQGLPVTYDDPRTLDYSDGNAMTNEITLDNLPLPVKSSMTFVFDFGDWWEFDVKLEKVKSGTFDDFMADVTAAEGEPPEQYPDYDEMD